MSIRKKRVSHDISTSDAPSVLPIGEAECEVALPSSPEMRQEPDYQWEDEDRKYVEHLIDMAFACKKHAFKRCASLAGPSPTAINEAAETLLAGILIVMDLLRAFQLTGHPYNIEHGVAKRLGLTRNGVYFRLDRVKLDPDDFCGDRVQIGSLIKKSKRLRQLATLVRKFHAEHEVPVSALQGH